jgi:hypothetical protein
MTCLRPSRFLVAAAIALWPDVSPGGFALRAQSTPEIREILDRLQKLEEANHALTDEVHSLRQELAATKSSAPTEVAAQTQDQIAVEKARVDELAQSKVESSQKLPIRVTGMALFNAYVNGRYNAGTENTPIASTAPGDATGGGSLRQSILGLAYDSPQTVLGAKVSGSLNLDFFGGSANSLDHLVRLRTATISLDWENTSILVGQDKPIISPRDPTSFAQVGVSPLTGAGNLWLWQPQIRIEQRIALGETSGLRVQAGVVQTRELGDEADGYNSYVPPPTAGTPPVEHAEPGAEARVELWHRWSDNARIEIAPGFHYNSSTVGPYAVPSQIFSLDWLIKPMSHLELSGFFYQGQNVADLGALPQGWVFHGYPDVRAVHSTGGWAQLRIPVTDRLAFDFYSGRQDDRNSDLSRGYIGLNAGYFANVMYRIAPNVIVSVEGGQVRTLYLGNGTRLNNHYDLAFAYLF